MNFSAVPLPAIFIMCACALLAVAIFAPRAPIVPNVSFAPAVATPVAAEPSAVPLLESAEVPLPPTVAWPELVDASAAGADVATRLALVAALAAVRTPWADAILTRALRDESDDDVLDMLFANAPRPAVQ